MLYSLCVYGRFAPQGAKEQKMTTEKGKEATVKDGQQVYMVLSVSDLRNMMRIARERSKLVYKGKVRGQSTIAVYANMVMGYDSDGGAIQLDVKVKDAI